MNVLRNKIRALCALSVLTSMLVACPPAEPAPPDETWQGDAFAAIIPVDSETVKIVFRVSLDADTVKLQNFSLSDFTQQTTPQLALRELQLEDVSTIILRTERQQPGTIYTLWIRGLKDRQGRAVEGSINFTAVGEAALASLSFRVLDVETAQHYGALRLWLNIDANGQFDPAGGRLFDLQAGAQAWEVQVDVAVAPARTVTRSDDGDLRVDRRAYVARLLDADNMAVSPLVPFALAEAGPQTIDLPLLAPNLRCPDAPVPELVLADPPADENPGDGLSVVRIVIDDRQSRELIDPALSLTLDTAGQFSLEERQVPLQQPQEPGLWECTVHIAVDAARNNMDIANAPVEELPVIAFLVNDGVKRNDFYRFIPVLEEAGQIVQMHLGAPGLIPATLRVDAGAAFLTADGSQRGLYANEALFITGNFVNIVDAFGQNCADSWSGGENLNLRMREDPEHPGLWQKTLWMPPGRAQSFKVLRCDAAQGCAALNARVTSTGYAFVSVAKNLVTENLDASEHAEVRLVDPHALDAVRISGHNFDYSDAHIYQGQASGREDNPPGMPDSSLLFKQEMPNLVVNLLQSGDCPAQTPIYVVGTWRDVNLPKTPAQILADIDIGDPPLDLSPYDYDDGLIGLAALHRELP